MKHSRWKVILDIVQRSAWAAFLLAIPITSFPYFPPAMGGEALVRPLSLYPLIVLLILAVVPRLVSRPLPKTLLTLLPFVLVATASSLLSLSRGIEPALGVSASARVVRGLFTLAIGCSIYFTIALLPDTIEDLRFSLRWILTGCAMALAWGSLQAVYIFRFSPAWFSLLDKLQSYVSIRHLFEDRISGFAFEPHWFADQIILLILPWALAAAFLGYTVFRWHWHELTVEWLLLGWSVLILPFTFSRSGILSFVILVFLSVLIFRRRANPPIISHKRPRFSSLNQAFRRRLDVLLIIIMLFVPIYIIGAKNAFFARIWEYWRKPEISLVDYLSYLGLDARLTYSLAAINTYEAHPVLGVGLGNYAFYFEEMLPDRPIAAIPEVLKVITPEKGRDRLITAKNFYLRLLAETGIVGAVAFLAFIIANLGCALYLRLSPDDEQKYWGTASLCGLIAFSLSALTFDSFVIPNMWVLFGLIAASFRVFERPARHRREID